MRFASLTLFILLLTHLPVYCQHAGLSISKNHTYINLKVGYCKSYKKANLEIGIKFHINNSNSTSSKGGYYYNRFYAANVLQHIGLYTSYSYNIYSVNELTSIYWYALSDFNYMGVKGYYDWSYDKIDTFGNPMYWRGYYSTDKFLSMDFCTGFGIKARIGRDWKFFVEGGSGILLAYLPGGFKQYINGSSQYDVESRFAYDPLTWNIRAGILIPIKRLKSDK
ncbi:MAG: hypothetical protein H7296_10270 [Bacteroidia bacterium]|nr:hypothetical protein [Bacteroidia bacterium]